MQPKGSPVEDRREAAAREAWQPIAAYAGRRLTEAQAKQLLAIIGAFGAKHGKTGFYTTVRADLARLRSRAEQAAGRFFSSYE